MIIYDTVKGNGKCIILEQVLSRHLKNITTGLYQLWYLNGHTEGLNYLPQYLNYIVKFIKILQNKMVWICQKDAKPKNAKLQQLQ
jgi:hypothetical protein